MRVVHPIFPPPGLNLEIPKDLTPDTFCRQIGGDCYEYADKFENIDQVFTFDSVRTYWELLRNIIETNESSRIASNLKKIHTQ